MTREGRAAGSSALRGRRGVRLTFDGRHSPQLRGLRLSVPLAGLLLVGVACEGESEDSLRPGGFRIEASDAPAVFERWDPETGTLERGGVSLAEHIALGWGADVRDLDVQIRLPPGDYDLSARSLDGTLETAEALLRGGLVEHFGLRVRPDRRVTDVIALRLTRTGLRPEPVTPSEVTAQPRRAAHSYRGAGAPVSDLVQWLRPRAQRPVVDETGLVGLYDIAIEWDPSAGQRALQFALRDAGLVLARARRPYAFLVVEQAP